ncbi:hypothetical protein AB1Y20_004795 [Prymnesium parvum]|uniref:Uncharacterized protein n=1 Tax=Prymnesium parvum TaxID=97485 RepID=A0AB34J198_PRYPA
MEEPVRQADGAVVIEGCHKPPETIRTLSARVAPRVLDERAEPPDLLVASYGQGAFRAAAHIASRRSPGCCLDAAEQLALLMALHQD